MTAQEGDCEFVSKLDDRSREIARTELHELNENDTQIAVQTLRQWVLEQSSWLTSPTDFEFLLRFLRARKFSQLEARKSLENYWTCKTNLPQWYMDVDPANEGVQGVLRSGFMYAPKKYDKFGRRLIICTAGEATETLIQTYGIDTMYKASFLVLEWLATDENVQVNGLASLYDHTNIDYMAMAKLWTPNVAKDYMQFFQKAVPIRYKTIAIYNESAFFDLMMTIMKPFVTDKMKNRIETYGNTLVKLFDEWGKESFVKDYLPDEYDGPCLGTKAENIDAMIKEMLEPKFRDYIKDLSSGKYKVDTKVRKHDTQEEVASFRKLNVD